MTITLPPALLFGYWGSALTPWLMILSSDHKNNAALIAHEQCHQMQQRRDGLLTFWWRYFTSREWKLAYEVEAYQRWVEVKPEDENLCARWLAFSYGFDITVDEAYALLKKES
jgi:hypothetical protein